MKRQTTTLYLPYKSAWLFVYGLILLAQLISVALHLSRVGIVATGLLAPLLSVWVWRARGPKLLVLVFVLFWVGDVLGNPRLLGIGPNGLFLSVAAFAAANVILLALYFRHGTLIEWRTILGGHQRWRAGVAVLCLIAVALGLALAWSSLNLGLRLAASIYLLLLLFTLTAALAVDIRAGVGSVLLLISHLLVVLEVAGRLLGTATRFRLLVLALYGFGILLIAVGVVTGRNR
jgi:hypothetical protein